MLTIRDTIERVFRKIKYDRYHLAINMRFLMLGIIDVYSAGLSVFTNTTADTLVIIFSLITVLGVVNYKMKKHYYLFNRKEFLYLFYFCELSIITFGIYYSDSSLAIWSHPFFGIYLSSILVSSFHGKREIVYFTIIFSTILKAFLFMLEVKSAYFMGNYFFLTALLNLFVTISFNLLHGLLVLKLMENYRSAQKMISGVTFKNIFDNSLRSFLFDNKEQTFFSRLLIKSEIKQSDNYGGGDFVFVSEVNGWVYGVIGDLTGHGSNMLSGTYLAGIVFKNTLNILERPKTYEILRAINKALHDLDILQGGRGLAIAFRVSKEGDFFYSGFIHKSCMKIGGQIARLSKPYSLGEKKDYKISTECYASLRNSDIEITTDGWTADDDDKARLQIKWMKH